jgi:hypothetical protein
MSKEQRSFENCKKSWNCKHCNQDGQLFIQRVDGQASERCYGYVVHPATWTGKKKGHRHKLTKRHRCYVGLLSKRVR